MNRLKRDVARHFNIDPTTAGILITGVLALMIDERSGGVEGFIARFRSAGLRHAMDSWIDGVTLRALNERQLRRALGDEVVGSLASAAGLGRGGTAAILTYLVPRLVNRSTPGGKIPTTDELRVRTSRFREAHDGYAGRVDRSAGGAPRRRRSPAFLVLAWLSIPVAALAAWLFLRPVIPTAVDVADAEAPVLEVDNAGETVSYRGRVRDELARSTIVEALNSTFGADRLTGDLAVDENVGEAAWVNRLDALLTALDTPGAAIVLTGDSARVEGRLSDEARAALSERIRDALAGSAAVDGDSARATEAAEESP